MVTTTYLRRHRLKNKEDPETDVRTARSFEHNSQNNIRDDEDHPPNASARLSGIGGRKRSADPGLDHTQPEPKPRKKRKLTKEATSTGMSIQPFQTPFPTLQAQSQVFRLPSSRPQSSPEEHESGLLSPVPIRAADVPKAKLQKENQIRKSGNTSQYTETLKSSRGHGDSTKTLSSTTLTSEAFPFGQDNRLSRRHHDHGSKPGSRSTSCSSSNSIASRNVKGKSELKHAQSSGSLKNDSKKARKKQKSGKSKHPNSKLPSSRTLNSRPMTEENFLSLASPFISRASSPVADANDDAVGLNQQRTQLMGPPPVPDTRKRASSGHGLRTALSDTFYNPNLPSNAGKSQSAGTSPQKRSPTKVDLLTLKIKTKPSSKIENRVPKQGSAFGDHERRPSAPSWLHPPRPKKRFSERPFMKGERDATGKVPWEKQKMRLSSGLNIVLGSKARTSQEAMGAEVPRNAPKQSNFQDPEDAMEWMHSRSDINFDRPPSQMSIGGSGFGYEAGFDYGEVEAGDVFFSSEEGEDEEDEEAQKALERQRKPLGQRIQEAAANSARQRRISYLDLDAEGVDQDFGALFGKDALIQSTPLKLLIDQHNLNSNRPTGYETGTNAVERKPSATLTRSRSLPNVSTAVNLSLLSSSSSVAPPGIGSDSSVSHDKSDTGKIKEAQKPANLKDESEDQDGEADMELTADAISTAIKVSKVLLQEASRDGNIEEVSDPIYADLTPWVTDSIISPPTLYLERERKTNKKGDMKVGLDGNAETGGGVGGVQGREDEGERCVSHVAQPMQFGSPFRSSDASTGSAGNTSFNVLSDTGGADEHGRTLDHHHENTSDSSDRLKPPTVVQDNDKPPLANAKRTRSGTIVPAGAPAAAPPGTRRTRGGTIIGPLPPAPAPAKPLPAVPSASGSGNREVGAGPGAGLVPRGRTRSGTIIASPAGFGPGLGTLSGGKTTRSGSVLRVTGNGVHTATVMADKITANDQAEITENNFDNTDPQNLEDGEQDEDAISEDVDCHVDSLYLPLLASSPDPIDFLRFANIVEEDEECGPDNMLWLVAEDPPSPEVPKNKKAGGGDLFRGGRFGSLRRKLGGKGGGGVKGNGKKKTRFVGHEGEEEQSEENDHDRLVDKLLSDDELLLIPGSTQSLWA